jgi:hypothetical protein
MPSDEEIPMSALPLSPRPVFDPYAVAPAAVVPGIGWRTIPRVLREFYRDRLSWLALGVTSAILCYVGGLAMFWFHAVELGEGGPAISWYVHWLLDSTVGFVALTPVLALIIPLAVYWSGLVAGGRRVGAVLAAYVVIAGGLFAVATVPGPIVHNTFVGRGTWLADRVTGWLGDPSAPLQPVREYPVSALLTQQLGAAIALYLVLTFAAVLIVRRLAARRRTPNLAVARALGRSAPAPGRSASAPGRAAPASDRSAPASGRAAPARSPNADATG